MTTTDGEAPFRYGDVVPGLRAAYDGAVRRRDGMVKAPWKLDERERFLARLREGRCARLLELGPGTGEDSVFFRDNGIDVVAVDLSPAMVARCRERGIEAHLMELMSLDFPPGSFDAGYAMNCLLHVPNADLPAVLRNIRSVLRPGGLFFLGEWGGDGTEGVWDRDGYDPPRFFSWRTDQQIERFARESFDVEDFHVVESGTWHFQSLTLSRPGR
ncbi:class I SAM-dependent methyltransferase [Rugosimonospora africana]|uniref:Methyltransferase domain-containing protein n=1 Tax=Rugosimonospora africana TaxID=556532 RepID=A0A8J3QR48_9ACTN|nr:class I SAM-dependent methyltransferase [Rugosimonospora africana]GIH15389.1 hypothetical protein Raf01_35610 [Rugosimonospora africana]